MTRRLLHPILLAALALPASASAADWPIYGHDLSNTRTAADGPPRAKLAGLAQAWQFKSPTGDFTGTPVVADGVVVAGDHGGWVYALDAVTGKLLWSHDAGAEINGTAAIDAHAPGGPAVFVPVAEIGGPRLLALSLRGGRKRWETVLNREKGASVFGSPVYWKGTIYMGTSGPNNDDATSRGSVAALDERTGEMRWQTFTVPPGRDGAAVWTTPAIDTATGRLYVGTGNNYHGEATDTADAILALDSRTGAVLQHYQATPGDVWGPDNLASGPDYDFGSSPNLIDGPRGERLVGAGQKSGTYWALERATLKPVWRRSLGPGGYLGGILGSTAYDGTRVYGVDATDGNVFGLGRDGLTDWTSRDTAGTHFGPTTVAHGVLYTVDPAGFVVARDPATGAELTRLSLDGPSFGGVSAVGGALYVSVGIGPPPEPAPQQDGKGSIVAFGDTRRSGGPSGVPQTPGPGPGPGDGGGGRRAPIRLSVTPRRVRAGRPVLLRFRATRLSRPVRGATIRLGRHRRVRTGRRGRATMRIVFHSPGVHRPRVSRPGMAGGRATIRVRRARR
jgi:polyvinyl alcohol dehydrogenase (cytochrome)